MSGRRVERLGMRAALALGFGLTLGLWTFTAYTFSEQMAAAERQGAAVVARYNRAQELLSGVRAQILLISVHVRDALLDPDHTSTARYRRRVDDAYARIESALGEYSPVAAAAGEGDDVLRLRAEIEQFRDTMSEMLELHASGQPVDVRELLNRRMVPRRESALGFSEQVQALNRAAFVQQQDASARIHRDAERRTGWYLGLALAASLGIGLLATAYAGRLEARLTEHSSRESRTADELQRLSAALIGAQESERRALARELHDDVGQSLTAIKVELSLAQRALDGDTPGREALGEAQAIADGALQRVRDLSYALHPSVLDDLGLADAVAWHLRVLARRHALRTELVRSGVERRLPADVEIAAYRIVQEALTNVIRHGHAASCRVGLAWSDDRLEVSIEDDGCGFNPARRSAAGDVPRGLGLISMRERAAQAGGQLAVESSLAHGTRIGAVLPAAGRPGRATPAVGVLDVVTAAAMPRQVTEHG